MVPTMIVIRKKRIKRSADASNELVPIEPRQCFKYTSRITTLGQSFRDMMWLCSMLVNAELASVCVQGPWKFSKTFFIPASVLISSCWLSFLAGIQIVNHVIFLWVIARGPRMRELTFSGGFIIIKRILLVLYESCLFQA